MTADGGDSVLDPENLFSVGNLVETEFLGYLGTNLRGGAAMPSMPWT